LPGIGAVKSQYTGLPEGQPSLPGLSSSQNAAADDNDDDDEQPPPPPTAPPQAQVLYAKLPNFDPAAKQGLFSAMPNAF
jgi:hypothetical protein